MRWHRSLGYCAGVPQTREADASHLAPSAQGSEKGQAVRPRKAKKLTMFGRLGAYQRRWGQAAAEATRAEADACQVRTVQVRRGCSVTPTDPVGVSLETWDVSFWSSQVKGKGRGG